MTIELIDTETESQNSEQEESSRKWHSYIERFVQPGDDVSEACKDHLTKKPVFLPRGIRSYAKSPFGKMKQHNHYKQPTANDTNADEGKEKADDKTNADRKGEDDSSTTVNSTDETKDESNKDKSKSSENSGSNHKRPPSTLVSDADVAAAEARLQQGNNGVIHDDNTQCKFSKTSFKILYVINSENTFYRRMALRRAKLSHKKVSRRKTGDFNRWHSTWLAENVSEAQHTMVADWFMGKTEGLVPNRTQKVVKNDMEKTPYRVYHKFKAEIVKQ